MIPAEDFCRTLLEEGYDYFTGVPCSYFKGVLQFLQKEASGKYFIAANEGSALGMASGAYLAGRRPVVMIQNSGFGNLVNPLTSLNAIYRIPALLLISGRGYGIPDEPQHGLMGRCLPDLLSTLGVPHQEVAQDLPSLRSQIKRISGELFKKQLPHALVIRGGTLGEGAETALGPPLFPLTRIQAIRVALEFAEEKTLWLATTGMTSRELFSLRDHPSQLYLMGSMGHAMAVGCALASERPDFKVVVLDGDGSAIMHLGTLSTIGHYRPKNLIQLILDNESYESTGNQDTTSRTTDLAQVGRACGIPSALRCEDEAGYRQALREAFSREGPHLLHVKVNRIPAERLPRITTRYTPEKITENFLNYIERKTRSFPK